MLTDVQGLVETLELSPSKGMMPLFEAISNAIDAIAACEDGLSHHEIRIRLIANDDLVKQAGDD